MPTDATPQINVPPTVRFALYVATVLGTPIIEYLRARGIIGGLEVALWGAETTAVAAMAAFNVVRLPSQDSQAASMAYEDPAPAADVPSDPAADPTP